MLSHIKNPGRYEIAFLDFSVFFFEGLFLRSETDIVTIVFFGQYGLEQFELEISAFL